MIRGKIIHIFLLTLFITLTLNKFENIEIASVERNINLASKYPTEAIKIKFIANQDAISHYSYLLPLEYDSKIATIAFPKTIKDEKSLPYHRSIYIHSGITYAHYRVQLPFNHQIGDQGTIFVSIHFINRYRNLPKSITMNEDQKLQYEDTKFMISPYDIKEQVTTYKYAKILDYEQDGEKKGLGQVQFQSYSTEPFHLVKHTVFGVNNNPQVVITEVQKIIQVSHWGNVAISQSYKLINTGPALKGQFSRVTYGSRSGADAKNAFRGIEFDLPSQIWGMYYLDQVGNISTSRAYREYDKVHVALQPRFALLGGWKSNWQIGYNFNTQGHLFHNGNQFQLKNVKLEYALKNILTEDYSIKIILPHGSTNVRIRIDDSDYDMSLVETTTSEGYLDFNGRPTFIIDHYSGLINDRQIQVFYDYTVNSVYEKPVALFLIVLGFLLLAVFAKRFTLKAFRLKHHHE